MVAYWRVAVLQILKLYLPDKGQRARYYVKILIERIKYSKTAYGILRVSAASASLIVPSHRDFIVPSHCCGAPEVSGCPAFRMQADAWPSV